MTGSDERRLQGRTHRAGNADGAAILNDEEEERQALIRSYLFSFLLAAFFLVVVHLTPAQAMSVVLPPHDDGYVQFLDEPEEPDVPTPSESPAASSADAAPRRDEPRRDPRAAASAFRSPTTAGTAVADLLRGVEVSRGGSHDATPGSRAVLSAGSGHAATPGLGGTTGSDAGIGLGVTGGISRGSVRIPDLEVVAPPMAGRGRDGAALGDIVRSRQAELQNCYREHGLPADPALAGLVRIGLSLASDGRVTDARIASRSWTGDGARATESCVLRRVGSWRFPATDTGDQSWSFAVQFTR